MKTISKNIQVNGKSGRIVVRYGLENTNHTYFAITATIYSHPTSTHDKYHEMGGCIHDEIERYFPDEFTDLIALHLSDKSGEPMYAVENGFYHWSNGKNEWVKNLLRMTESEYIKFDKKLHSVNHNDVKTLFTAYVVENKERWTREANAAIEKHSLLEPVVA